ncbi:hypothetical protein COOONC_18287 [Cooperia oncophora]
MVTVYVSVLCGEAAAALYFAHKHEVVQLNQRTWSAIRVVKAFQAGLDRREPSLTGTSAARLREISRQLRLQTESEARSKAV